ncbi:MAG: hypothetical protein O3A46_04490 [Candidatus Poribacteria bacterium]|nr:hypothetical protein [Candidatus Poribacteria bacterium]
MSTAAAPQLGTLTVEELFTICEDIELRNAKLYAAFMIQLGSDDERVAQFWEEMSGEEWDHYVVLSFGRDLCERAGVMKERIRGFDHANVAHVREIMETNERRVAKGTYSLHDAFQMAIEFETSEGDAFFLHLVRQIRQAINRLGEYHLEKRIQKMGVEVHNHVDSLVNAIKKFGNSPDLVRQARAALDHHAH